MHSYCMYCIVQKCATVVSELNKMGLGKALMPQIIQRKWVKGKTYEEVHEYLPGYVFLYTEEPIPDFGPLWQLPSVVRLLGSSDDLYELHGSDRAFARLLYETDGTIGILKAVKEGSVVKLDRSLFGDFEGKIVRFDHGRKRAEVEFDFDGRVHRVWVGVEWITPVPEAETEET